jgi:hypothetical protein
MGPAQQFDGIMVQTVLDLITPVGYCAPACSAARLARARARLQLPIRHKGVGLIPIAARAPVQFFASVIAAAAQDELLAENLIALGRFAVETHELVIQRVGPVHNRSEKVEEYLHRDNSGCMLDASLFAGFFESDPTLKLQKMLMKVALAKSADDLRSLESKISHSVNESDVVMANTPDTASLSPIFLASLAPKKNRIPPAEFGAFLRWFLRVPQLPKLSNESVYAH